jgi:hypothetical protein
MELLIKCITGPKFLYQFDLSVEGRPSAELHEFSLICTLRLARLLHITEILRLKFNRGPRIVSSRKMRLCHLNVMTVSFHILYNSSISIHPTLRRFLVSAVDVVLK